MQDNKKVDRKVESNDSLEIPDRGEHQKSPTPFGPCILKGPL